MRFVQNISLWLYFYGQSKKRSIVTKIEIILVNVGLVLTHFFFALYIGERNVLFYALVMFHCDKKINK